MFVNKKLHVTWDDKKSSGLRHRYPLVPRIRARLVWLEEKIVEALRFTENMGDCLTMEYPVFYDLQGRVEEFYRIVRKSRGSDLYPIVKDSTRVMFNQLSLTTLKLNITFIYWGRIELIMVGLVVDEELIRGLISQGFSIRVNRIKGRLYLYAVKYLGPVSGEEAEKIKRILEESSTGSGKSEPERNEAVGDSPINLSDVLKRVDRPGRKIRGIVEKLADPSRSSYGYQLLHAFSQGVEKREVFESIVKELEEALSRLQAQSSQRQPEAPPSPPSPSVASQPKAIQEKSSSQSPPPVEKTEKTESRREAPASMVEGKEAVHQGQARVDSSPRDTSSSDASRGGWYT